MYVLVLDLLMLLLSNGLWLVVGFIFVGLVLWLWRAVVGDMCRSRGWLAIRWLGWSISWGFIIVTVYRYELAVSSIVHWDVDFFSLIWVRLTVFCWLRLVLVTVMIVLMCLQLLLVLMLLLLYEQLLLLCDHLLLMLVLLFLEFLVQLGCTNFQVLLQEGLQMLSILSRSWNLQDNSRNIIVLLLLLLLVLLLLIVVMLFA